MEPGAIVTARFTAVPRLARLAEFASTSRMWQFGQIAETMSTSREISPGQPASAAGSSEKAPSGPRPEGPDGRVPAGVPPDEVARLW